MNTSPPKAVNHHADHPGFSGVTGLLFGFALLFLGRANARLAVDVAAVTDADHVVDVGCGAGGAVRAAARRGARVTGVDPSPVMLRLARIFTRGRADIGWAEGSAESLPMPDNSATVVWSLATVHHWKNLDKGLVEACRVLVPGGRMLAVERQVDADATGLASHGWTAQQAEAFAAHCRAAGFGDVRVEGRGAGRRAVWIVRCVQPV